MMVCRSKTRLRRLICIPLPLLLPIGLSGPVAAAPKLSTPVQHLVVLLPENRSFDHYFGTYPYAANPPGEPRFQAKPDTPGINGLTAGLMAANRNAAQPFRLDHAQAVTCDPAHEMSIQQLAANHGLMDKFVENTGTGKCAAKPEIPMGHFDGNTVTALWNYAQHFAMSDNFHSTLFAGSTPGHINLVSGQTHGTRPEEVLKPGGGDEGGGKILVTQGSLVANAEPMFDDCAKHAGQVEMLGPNIGDLLNRKGITWGYFQGGFTPTSRIGDQAVCGATHKTSDGKETLDYTPHHEPFQYYRSTSNPHHLPPQSVASIGLTDQANHQYDIDHFWAAAEADHQPAVSFIKPPAYQNEHAGIGKSSPLEFQRFLVNTLNRLQRLPSWNSTVVLIAYDDSGGWYDHVFGPVVGFSALANVDSLTGPGQCGDPVASEAQGRCGYGMRLPLLAISPFARRNYVGHGLLDQASVTRFIEDNWGLGRIGGGSFDETAGDLRELLDLRPGHQRAPKLFLNPDDGTVR
ncbi:MAG: alkaline phosphatase family protein [Methylococcus sp.]|nr:alkaline phosphatase family protein [Methylococcus sp.]